MSDDERSGRRRLTEWLGAMRAALRGERTAMFPCDGCTACCTSSQFVHIGPEETDTLAHIPRELVFPAPLLRAATSCSLRRARTLSDARGEPVFDIRTPATRVSHVRLSRLRGRRTRRGRGRQAVDCRARRALALHLPTPGDRATTTRCARPPGVFVSIRSIYREVQFRLRRHRLRCLPSRCPLLLEQSRDLVDCALFGGIHRLR